MCWKAGEKKPTYFILIKKINGCQIILSNQWIKTPNHVFSGLEGKGEAKKLINSFHYDTEIPFPSFS